ncbi:MAG: T9SS type A sorting domain-containing protein, partial [Candidatus Margulisbacteria bacterium]|nr:T9SS type A sorting domain-containing protein [Candidatus Margulisiibacteriota bacterium]
LPNSDVLSLAVDPDGYLYAATRIGVYKSTSSVITSVDNNISFTPAYISLGQNYPNPFNPTTTIKYSIPKNDFVNLTIYDILGKAIKTLVNEEKPAGGYEVNFDASNLSSGVYLYKLQTGSYTQVKKLMLLK